jgi:hypothetical protein
MPDPTSNSSPSGLPGPISEEQMVDWIDNSLSSSEVDALSLASGRSDIRQRVQQLQRNKQLLASFPLEAAPADLHDRVLAALERDALLGVSPEQWAQVEESAQPVDTLPIDRFATQRDGASRARNWWSAAPTLAMAASILLLVGGGVLLYPTIRAAMQPAPALRPSGPIASNQQSPVAPAPATNEVAGTRDETASTSIATATDANAILAGSPQPSSQPIDSARALQLAQEGRLIVRLLAKDVGSLPRVEATATNPQSRLPWRLTRDVPAAVVAAMMPKAPGEPEFASAKGLRTRTESMLSAFASPAAAFSMPSPQTLAQSSVRGTYVLDVQHSSLSFSQALDMLSKGLSATVQYEESPQALPLQRQQRPQDVLWWTQPASQWSDRVAVPIIVQRG